MNEQPEALRVADWLERDGANCQQHLDAARLLREQHEGIEQLGAQLSADWEMISEHRAEIEELREAVRAEREECAKVCDAVTWSDEGRYFAKAIRARE